MAVTHPPRRVALRRRYGVLSILWTPNGAFSQPRLTKAHCPDPLCDHFLWSPQGPA